MAILNKLGSIARNVSGRTGNMLEVSKLNALIRSSEDDIEELKQQLGEYFYWQIRRWGNTGRRRYGNM